MEKRITDNIQELKRVLPERIKTALDSLGNTENLLEIVLDLGREPTARFTDREAILSEGEVTHQELEDVVENIGQFDTDNRAGMERTLHRISAIRNRKGQVVGLTCRVGRAVYGPSTHPRPDRDRQEYPHLVRPAWAKTPCYVKMRACCRNQARRDRRYVERDRRRR